MRISCMYIKFYIDIVYINKPTTIIEWPLIIALSDARCIRSALKSRREQRSDTY